MTPESLGNILEKNISEWESLYGTDVSERILTLCFAGIIKRACEQTGQRVVILCGRIRQTDAPGHRQRGTAKEYRNTLKPFYGVLKTMDGCIKLAFLTGVTLWQDQRIQ